MTPLLKKMNFKNQNQIFVFNEPEEIMKLFKSLPESKIFKFDYCEKELEFAMAFVFTQQEINHYAELIIPKLKGDAVFWMCYPKTTSKRYKCDINRDKGWEVLGKYNLEGVRQVAVDENWSALRFRKVGYIRKLTRKFDAISEQGKIKTGQIKNK